MRIRTPPVIAPRAVWSIVSFGLIFAGVLGGMLAFGLTGLLVGPVVPAVTYTLLVAWVTAGEPPPP